MSAADRRLPEQTGEIPIKAMEGRPLLREMLDLPSFTEVCTSFVDLYRVGMKVYDEDGSKLVDIKIGSSEFCAYMFTKPKGRMLCTETVTHIKQFELPLITQTPGTAPMETRNCFTGLRYIMTPIVHEAEPLGRVILGPFAPNDMQDIALTISPLDSTFEAEKARTLLGKIRKTDETNIRRVLDHFMKIMDVLIFSSYRAHLTSQMHIASIGASYHELQEKAAQLEESNAHLQELDRLKSNFLATMSHELRTPLTSVIGYSEMLLAGLAGNLPEEQRTYLQTILEKGESLRNLLSSILDLSKIEARGVELRLAPADVPEILRAAASTHQTAAKQKNIMLDVDSPEFKPRPILDVERVKQCVSNLISNAVKFTGDGGRVSVDARLAGENVEIAVTDTGIGIAPIEHERIFDNFYQVDGSATRKFGGAGLGLAIVRSVVEAHGGYVTLDSDVGLGSTFTLVFPTGN